MNLRHPHVKKTHVTSCHRQYLSYLLSLKNQLSNHDSRPQFRLERRISAITAPLSSSTASAAPAAPRPPGWVKVIQRVEGASARATRVACLKETSCSGFIEMPTKYQKDTGETIPMLSSEVPGILKHFMNRAVWELVPSWAMNDN